MVGLSAGYSISVMHVDEVLSQRQPLREEGDMVKKKKKSFTRFSQPTRLIRIADQLEALNNALVLHKTPHAYLKGSLDENLYSYVVR